MLVSTIAKLSAINTMNTAAYNMMYSQNLMNHAFRGDMNNYADIYRFEQANTTNLLKNQLLYKISSAMLENNKNNINYLA